MNAIESKRAPRGPGRSATRSAARLAAVQAIYQIELGEVTPAAVIQEYAQHLLTGDPRGEDAGDQTLIPHDRALFAELVDGTCLRQPELDARIAGVLPPDWPLERLEAVLRAILRVGTYEISVRLDIPVRVAISEYVDVAHAFFAGKEPGMVNGVLDRLARDLRSEEMAAPHQSLARSERGDGTAEPVS